MRDFLRLALRRDVLRRSTAYGVLVGGLLIAINQGDHLLAGDLDGAIVLKLILTPLVPFCVSTFSSVGALSSEAS